MKKKLRLVCGVTGDGFWSTWQGTVDGTLKLERYKYSEEYNHGSARFYIDDWDLSHGLIYTDSLFISDIQNNLKNLGFKHWEGINYSEQGMQGDNYVDMDCTNDLLNEAVEKGYYIKEPDPVGKKPPEVIKESDENVKIELLETVKCILEAADSRLSWDQLPNRSRIQDALKFTNTLISLEK